MTFPIGKQLVVGDFVPKREGISIAVSPINMPELNINPGKFQIMVDRGFEAGVGVRVCSKSIELSFQSATFVRPRPFLALTTQ
jgi:hypothetical protein